MECPERTYISIYREERKTPITYNWTVSGNRGTSIDASNLDKYSFVFILISSSCSYFK